MEMCYDGALVMPKNCAIVSEEEMTYVDGGGILYDISIGLLTGLVSAALFESRKAIVAAAVKGAVAAYGWVSSVVSSAAAWAVANPAVALGILAGVTGFVVGVVAAVVGVKC